MKSRAIVPMSEQDIKRFLSHVRTSAPSECWLWQLGLGVDGYGKFSVKRITYRAHRIAYFIHYQTDPQELLVCHTCDNPRCCNPAHLFLGTEAVNSRDCKQKNRLNTAFGETHGTKTRPDRVAKGEGKPKSAILTEEQVRAIRDEHARGGVSYSAIARRYAVDRKTIEFIVKRVNWKHVN